MLISAASYNPLAEDPNLIASQTASKSYPPASMKSLPRPKTSHASHRTRHPTKERNYPDRLPVSVTNAPVELLPESESAPNLQYYVTRTPSQNFPIYLEKKRGGNLHQTRLKGIDGSPEVLRDALEKELRLKPKDCLVNATNGHIVMKGWYKPQIEAFLKARRF